MIGLGSVLSLALVDRRWMVWILHKIPRTRDASSALVPSQRAIVVTYAAALVTIATLSLGYFQPRAVRHSDEKLKKKVGKTGAK